MMTGVNKDKQGVYQNHRDNQVERILEAAEMLFIRDGIDHVSMSAIAKLARIARKTLYRYFSDRDDIARAIYEKLLEEMTVTIPAESGGNAYQQLEQFMTWLLKELEVHPEHQRFLIEFNTLYAREQSLEGLHKSASPSGSGAKERIAELVRQGMEDGSLRTDLQPDKVSAAFLNLLIGMNARFALLGEMIESEYAMSGQEIYREICSIFLRGLQPG